MQLQVFQLTESFIQIHAFSHLYYGILHELASQIVCVRILTPDIVKTSAFILTFHVMARIVCGKFLKLTMLEFNICRNYGTENYLYIYSCLLNWFCRKLPNSVLHTLVICLKNTYFPNPYFKFRIQFQCRKKVLCSFISCICFVCHMNIEHHYWNCFADFNGGDNFVNKSPMQMFASFYNESPSIFITCK